MQLILFPERRSKLFNMKRINSEISLGKNISYPAVITVYLTLILTLILALIAVSVESAILSVAKVQGERILTAAMQSVLAEYYEALYKEYHIFALDTGFSGTESNEGLLKFKTEQWITDNLSENSGQLILCNLNLKELQFTKKKTLFADNGDVFWNEVISYQKYKSITLLAEQLLGSLGLLNEAEEVQKIVSRQLEAEKKLVVIDESMQKLMELIDGVQFKDGKIMKNIFGTVVTADEFSKRLLASEVTEESSGIYHTKLFNNLEGKYENVLSILDQMIENGEIYLTADSELYNESRNLLQSINQSCYAKVEAAIEQINVIRFLQEDAKDDVKALKIVIEQAKDNVSDELLKGLNEGLSFMEGYVSEDSSSLCINLSEAERVLVKQQEILDKIINTGIPELPEDGIWGDLSIHLETIRKLYIDYPSGKPVFDYQSLIIDTEDSMDFLTGLSNLIDSGILGLVVDEATLSDVVLSGEQLPSQWYGSQQVTGSGIAQLMDFIKNSEINELLSLNSLSDMKTIIEQDVSDILEKIIFISYVEDNFSNYNSTESRGKLSYETEYLLSGDLVDKENLSSAIVHIFMIRFTLNLFYTMSNTACRNQAGTAAAAIVGFSGFPALISLVKYLVLIVWAITAALVEVAGLLQGKKISLFVTDTAFCVDFHELLTMNHKTIREKAGNIKESDIGFQYKDYLRLFLLIQPKDKLCFYSMDLIQENIRSGYEENFFIKNCITSYEVEASYLLPQKFLLLPIMANQYSVDSNEFLFRTKKEIMY